MIRTIKSFGCSFLDGTDLNCPSNTWPALIAKDLGLEHVNYAQAGIGNLQILERVLSDSDPSSINVISWTWIDRFDFCSGATEKWETLRPSLDHPLADTYYRKFHGQYKDMLSILIYIQNAINHLKKNHCPFMMTTMDTLIFEKIQPTWHDSRAVDLLQHSIRPYIVFFEGKTFLEWSREKEHDISDKWHPLDSAHSAASLLMSDRVRSLIMEN